MNEYKKIQDENPNWTLSDEAILDIIKNTDVSDEAEKSRESIFYSISQRIGVTPTKVETLLTPNNQVVFDQTTGKTLNQKVDTSLWLNGDLITLIKF